MQTIKALKWLWSKNSLPGESITGPYVALLLGVGAVLLSLILVLLKVEDSLWWGLALAALFFLLVVRFILVWDKTINLLWPWKGFIILLVGVFYCWLVGKQVLARYHEQRAVKISLQGKYDSIQKMTLHDFFKNDFPNTMKLGNTIVCKNTATGSKTNVEAQLYLNDYENSEFVGYYIPSTNEIISRDRTRGVIESISSSYSTVLNWGSNVTSRSIETAQDITTSGLTPTSRVYVYHEDDLNAQDIARLSSIYQSKGQKVLFRGSEYVVDRRLFMLAEANLSDARPQ